VQPGERAAHRNAAQALHLGVNHRGGHSWMPEQLPYRADEEIDEPSWKDHRAALNV